MVAERKTERRTETGPDAGDVRALFDGAVFRSVGRAVSMGVMEFTGPDGREVALHIQCRFRILHKDRVIIGSQDMRYPRKGAGADAFDAFQTMYDTNAEKLTGVLGEARPRVAGVTLGRAGALTLDCEHGFAIEVFPDCSGPFEAWRAFARPDGDHLGYPPELL
ncbi:hypothetical protein NX801_00080 [Streptomyces sp. LP05-1]|uniref:Uncharacterized protein n=1 Tax=Streptomyces pyxinae TaxID=2970734 RepID=A0ABT2C9L4_9ACTN|nr:hypothetical protein [Streptomyces sp. LP05-1]MCS0634085.1 hypothetical protein [Streptomyces sp. LP05-1]